MSPRCAALVMSLFTLLFFGTAAAADGVLSDTPTALALLLGTGGGVAGLIVWVVKRLINILASEMQATREAFTGSLDKLVQHDAEERARDRQVFSETLRQILAVAGE